MLQPVLFTCCCFSSLIWKLAAIYSPPLSPQRSAVLIPSRCWFLGACSLHRGGGLQAGTAQGAPTLLSLPTASPSRGWNPCDPADLRGAGGVNTDLQHCKSGDFCWEEKASDGSASGLGDEPVEPRNGLACNNIFCYDFLGEIYAFAGSQILMEVLPRDPSPSQAGSGEQEQTHKQELRLLTRGHRSVPCPASPLPPALSSFQPKWKICRGAHGRG